MASHANSMGWNHWVPVPVFIEIPVPLFYFFCVASHDKCIPLGDCCIKAVLEHCPSKMHNKLGIYFGIMAGEDRGHGMKGH